MNLPARSAALLGAAAVVTAGCAGNRTNDATTAVPRILQEQADAWNRGDLDAFMQYYWPSDRLTFSAGGQTERGWQSTYQRYKRRYPTPAKMGQLQFSDLEITPLSADAALTLGRWQLERAEPVGGTFSLVLRKLGGRWLIIHDHTSALPVEPFQGVDAGE